MFTFDSPVNAVVNPVNQPEEAITRGSKNWSSIGILII